MYNFLFLPSSNPTHAVFTNEESPIVNIRASHTWTSISSDSNAIKDLTLFTSV
jgi:hypothetical protein